VSWTVRAVNPDGSLVSAINGVTIENLHSAKKARASARLSLAITEPNATHLALDGNELQILRPDGTLYDWYRAAEVEGDVGDGRENLTLIADGLFSYFFDEVVGGERENHIVNPNADASAVGAAPTSWTATAGVDAVAIVNNNVELWDVPKAIQVNNAEADSDAYIYQRYTVTADMVGVPFAPGAWVYVADGDGTGSNPPAWGGPAYQNRGLMVLRLDSTGSTVLSKQVAPIGEDFPRNIPQYLETMEVIPAAAGEIIEVRLYAPAAWTVWRWAQLFDGRAVTADRVDKTEAVVTLVTHAQDTSIGKQDWGIGTDVVALGETVSESWPWWRRDVIGKKLEDLADTFEFEMANTITETTPGVWTGTRDLKVRAQLGTDLSVAPYSVTLTAADFPAWRIGSELAARASRVIRQGEGAGITRNEWWVDDPAALNGNVRERLVFAPPGESLVRLRDHAVEELARLSAGDMLPVARIVGDLALTIRPYDTVGVNLTYGWASFVGNARVSAVDLNPAAEAAWLYLEVV
jgi:hypothetical protein